MYIDEVNKVQPSLAFIDYYFSHFFLRSLHYHGDGLAKNMGICVYTGCKSQRGEASFLRYPNSNDVLRKNFDDFMKAADRNWIAPLLNQEARICSKHFVREDFISYRIIEGKTQYRL